MYIHKYPGRNIVCNVSNTCSFPYFSGRYYAKVWSIGISRKNDVETWQQVKFHSFTPKPYEYVKKLELAKKRSKVQLLPNYTVCGMDFK